MGRDRVLSALSAVLGGLAVSLLCVAAVAGMALNASAFVWSLIWSLVAYGAALAIDPEQDK